MESEFLDGRGISGEINVDICVIGAGPAGLSVARELDGAGMQICLLESGNLAPDADAQDLCCGELAGSHAVDPGAIRIRQFGGGSTVWVIELGGGVRGARYTPLDPVDFQPRHGDAVGGWPFSPEHLAPYYERAHARCGLKTISYAGESWASADAPAIRSPSGDIQTTMFQFGLARVFHQECRERLRRSSNVRVVLNATVLELEGDADVNRIVRAHVGAFSDARFHVAAKVFVLACGALETPRLLLLSNRQAPAGLGNQHDLVGRFLMDHALHQSARITPADGSVFARLRLFDRRPVDGTWCMGKLTPAARAIREQGLLNMSALLFPREHTQETAAVAAFRRLVHRPTPYQAPEAAAGKLRALLEAPQDVATHVYRKLLEREAFCDLAHAGWSSIPRPERVFSQIDVVNQVEQLPRAVNRVALAESRDAFGQRRVQLDLRWTEDDQQRFRATQTFLAREFGATGLGTYRFDPDEPPTFLSSHHPMGTARMHPDPRCGVTDPDGRVHGLDNLFVADASLFPTGGYANPTLTVVALAIRLADHLKKRLVRGG